MANAIMRLGPIAGRYDLAAMPFSSSVAELYSRAHGASFVNNLGHRSTVNAIIEAVDPFLERHQVVEMIRSLYKARTDNDAMRRLLRAFDFLYSMDGDESRVNIWNEASLVLVRNGSNIEETCICLSCHRIAENKTSPGCQCGGRVVSILERPLTLQESKSLELHVPLELFVCQEAKRAQFHTLGSVGKDLGAAVSLTFNVRGIKADADSIILTHPPSVLLVAATTAYLDQGRIIRATGALQFLRQVISKELPNGIPVQIVVIGPSSVNKNVDLMGLERQGISVVSGSNLHALNIELVKIASRLR